MKRSVRAFVRRRAAYHCEYCQMHESARTLSFHLEHIVAKKHRGSDAPDNLAWSCFECNLGKSSNLSGRDPVTGRIVVLFNPRRQRWGRHFEWHGARLVGLTACGRATIDVLNINAPHRLGLRRLLIRGGVFPPE
jgi:5-methylcytosine-specific restriction endonuclease McrA